MAHAIRMTNARSGPDPTRPPRGLQATPCYYRVDRRDISLLRFILEAYEGVATLTTLIPEEGIVKIQVAPGQEALVMELLEALCASRDILIEPLAGPPPAAQGDE